MSDKTSIFSMVVACRRISPHKLYKFTFKLLLQTADKLVSRISNGSIVKKFRAAVHGLDGFNNIRLGLFAKARDVMNFTCFSGGQQIFEVSIFAVCQSTCSLRPPRPLMRIISNKPGGVSWISSSSAAILCLFLPSLMISTISGRNCSASCSLDKSGHRFLQLPDTVSRTG